MTNISNLILFIIPVLLVQLGLMIYCLLDLSRREKTKGPKWMWVLLIVLGELIGPVLYLVVGRVEE